MSNAVGTEKKKILPAALLVVLLIALVAFAFLPSVRNGGKTFTATPVSAADKIDKGAMEALERACAFVQNNDFSVNTRGEIKAKAFGIPHTQKVSGNRSVKDGVFSELAETKSAFIKVAVKKTTDGDGYDICKGSYQNKKFVYGKPKHMTEEEYTAAYGKPARGLVRYELDGNVLEAKTVKDGVYKFKLDAKCAACYSRNEVKTLTDSKNCPEYKAVSFTLYCDGDKPIKVCSYEKFRIDVCGGTDCAATYTDTFEFSA